MLTAAELSRMLAEDSRQRAGRDDDQLRLRGILRESRRFNPNEPRRPNGEWGTGGIAHAIKKAAHLDTSDFQTKDERTAEQVLDGAGKRVGAKWKVSDADLEALIREDGQWEHFQHLSPEEQRSRFAAGLIKKWNGTSGGPIATAAITHVLDKHGIDYELSDGEARPNRYIRSRPELERATASLGDAMYETTQDWFKEREITHLHVLRATTNVDRDKTRPYTSWTLHRGGLRDAGNRTIREEDVPVSRIFAIPPTGFGNLDESEVVMLPLPAK